MDIIIFFLGLFLVTTPLWAFIWLLKLSKRIKVLEAKAGIQKDDGLHTDSRGVQESDFSLDPEGNPFIRAYDRLESNLVQTVKKGTVVAEKKISSLKSQKKEKAPIVWEDFFTRKFFSIFGVISIIVAIISFTLWAFSSGLIAAEGRIAIGALVSLAILVGGEFLREKYPKFFTSLTSIGIAGLIGTTFVAANVYEFLDPLESLGLYAIEIITGVLLSLRYNSRLLANFSLFGAMLVPMFTEVVSDPTLLIGYMVCVSIGGFVVALRQNWIEVLLLLFLGVVGYEQWLAVFERGAWLQENEFLFIGLVVLLHLLLGSGGVIRMIRSHVKQRMTEDMPTQQVYEMILFAIALLSMNGFVYQAFASLEWTHFGFFVLLEGAVLYLVSEYLKQKQLLMMHRVGMAGGLIALIFATIWEIGIEHAFPLSLALGLEGILLIIAGKSIQDRLLQGFGIVALVFASLFVFDISEAWQSALAILVYGSGVFLCTNKLDPKNQPTAFGWGIVGIVWAMLLISLWNIEYVSEFISAEHIFVFYIIPALVTLGLAYVAFIRSPLARKVLSLVSLGGTNFLLWGEVIYSVSGAHWGPLFIVLLMVIALNMATLASFFMQDKDQMVSDNAKKGAIYTTLILSTLSLFLWGGEMWDEPYTSLLWLIWSLSLLFVGIYKQWDRFRMFGVGIMLFLIAKMYFIDVWEWDTGVRVIAFLGLGVSLLLISFLYQKKIDK